MAGEASEAAAVCGPEDGRCVCELGDLPVACPSDGSRRVVRQRRMLFSKRLLFWRKPPAGVAGGTKEKSHRAGNAVSWGPSVHPNEGIGSGAVVGSPETR
jgi:hypothetical protein